MSAVLLRWLPKRQDIRSRRLQQRSLLVIHWMRSKNAITQKTYASFEPMLDYCVVKLPRLPFDKFISAKRTLTTQMKATGEVMSICDNFEGALMKAIVNRIIPFSSVDGPGNRTAISSRAATLTANIVIIPKQRKALYKLRSLCGTVPCRGAVPGRG